MLSQTAREFLAKNHRGVLTTFRSSGGAQMSIVSCGLYRDGVAFTTTEDRAKLKNLRRKSRCAVLVSQPDWRGYLTVEGKAAIMAPDNMEVAALRMAFRDVYRAAGGGEHPNWAEYDKAMIDDRRAIVIVMPEKVYGNRV